MTLPYLEFDYSEDAEGTGTFDAMASVPPHHWEALQDDVLQALRWAHDTFGPTQDCLEDGGQWLYDLQVTHETATARPLTFDPRLSTLVGTPGDPVLVRITLTLSLSGRRDFCEAFRAAFELS